MSQTPRERHGEARPLDPSLVRWIPVVDYKLADDYPAPEPPAPPPLVTLLPHDHSILRSVRTLRPEYVFGGETAVKLSELIVRAQRMDPDYRPPRFDHIYRVRTEDVATAEALAKQLREHPAVDFAEVQRVIPPPGLIDPTSEPMSGEQVQLDPPQKGINARGAWALGADGAGVFLIDLERGYDPHVDLPTVKLVSGEEENLRAVEPDHGTAVLGILAADDQHTTGGIGIAPRADIGFAMRFEGSVDDEVIGPAITDATHALGYGDILLIDDQYGMKIGGSTFAMPIETHPVVTPMLDMIRTLGIVLVEPSGNGSRSIDDYCLPASSAIMVGGINSNTLKRMTEEFMSNFGERVDLHALYDGIVTSGWNADHGGSGAAHSTTAYTQSFHGTSATSAIIAGAAALLQSYVIKHLGWRLAPEALLECLRESGTPSGSADDHVGVMPDVGKCVGVFSKLSPLWVRASVVDPATVPRPPLGLCPDIIVRPEPPAPPRPPFPLPIPLPSRAPLPDLSGLFNPDTSSNAGIDIQVTGRNLGTTDLLYAVADVYAAPPAFMPLPSDWRRVGVARIGTLSAGGNPGTSTNPLFLTGKAIEKWGGVSLVAVLGARGQPRPSRFAIRDLEEAERFFANNLFVGVLTWVVPQPPSPQQPFDKWQSFFFPVFSPSHPNGPVRLHVKHTYDAGTPVKVVLPAEDVRLRANGTVVGMRAEISVPPGPGGTTIELTLEPGRRIRCQVDVGSAGGPRLRDGGFEVAQNDGAREWSRLSGRVIIRTP